MTRSLATLTGLLLFAGSVGAQQTESFDWSGTVAAGKTLEVRGVNGDIQVRRGSTLSVHAEKHGRRNDPSDVQIEVVEHADGVTICAVYPSRSGDRPNSCQSRGRGKNDTRNNDVQVDFTVTLPTGINAELGTVNGDIEAHDVGGNIQARTVNGNVDINGTGHAAAHTVNGSIRASFAQTNWNGEASFSTVNGGITLEIGEDANFDLTATTVNGSIDTDFPVQLTGRIGPRRVTGTVGSGGRSLRLSTVNGSMTLRRR